MSTHFRDKQTAQYQREASAFRTRADINTAYVHLKVEYDKLAELIHYKEKPMELSVNADLSALVVQLSETISHLGKRNANLQAVLHGEQKKVAYYEERDQH